MSVPVGKREEGKLQVLLEAQQLASYTLHICKNEKVFPKSYRWLLTQKIVNEALDVMSCVRRANAVRVESRQDYLYRHQQQVEAHAHIEALLGLIDLAYAALSIDGKRIEYWTGLAISADNTLRKWTSAYKTRYKDMS